MKRILVVDVGGNNVKVAVAGRKQVLKIPSGPTLRPARMVADVKKAIAGWRYDVVSIGYPGPVRDGRPSSEPANLGPGWVRFDYARAFGKPVRIVNDAAMQALGAYRGGRMLFLGLGTGLGSALVLEGRLAPLELAHMPYRKGRSYEDYVGARGLKRLGRKRWAKHVATVVALLRQGLQADEIVLGGGNTNRLDTLPQGVRRGDNAHAILGGQRLWDDLGQPRRRPRRKAEPRSKRASAERPPRSQPPALAAATRPEPAQAAGAGDEAAETPSG
jgi:predicted NBD/HSP70 family sugar kinase